MVEVIEEGTPPAETAGTDAEEGAAGVAVETDADAATGAEAGAEFAPEEGTPATEPAEA